MTNPIMDVSPRKAALISGYGILIMLIAFMLADTFVFQKLIVLQDAALTTTNISANELLFRFGICGFLIVIVCDILVSWSFYVLLKPVNISLALLMGWLRLVYSTIFAVALVNYFNILHLVGGSDILTSFEPEQLPAHVMLSINAFINLWQIGFIFFGLHLSFLGYLVFKAGYIPGYLGILLLIAGISYLMDHFSKFLFPDFALNTSLFTGWFELIFMIWLLIKGNKIPE